MENVNEQCTTCHNLITDIPNLWYCGETRNKIVKICLTQLFSELIDSSIIWGVSHEESPPFCTQCLEELEIISKLDDESENAGKKIEDFVDNFTMKVLRSRKAKDKFVISEENIISTDGTGKTIMTMPAQQQEGLSMYKEEQAGKECCKMCYDDYVSTNGNEKLEMETVRKILHVCEKHFFKELISNGSFDWNSIGLNKFLSFCGSCFDNIKIVCEMNEEIERTGNEVSTAVEKFIITLLKSRKSVKEKGVNKYFFSHHSQSKNFKPPTSVWDTPALSLSNYSPNAQNQKSNDEHSITNEEKPQIIISNPRSLSLEKDNADSNRNSSEIFGQTSVKQTRMIASFQYNEMLVPEKVEVEGVERGEIFQTSMIPVVALKNLFPKKHMKTMSSDKQQGTFSGNVYPWKKSRIPKPLQDPVYEWNIKKYKVKKPNASCIGLSTVRKQKTFTTFIKCTKCPRVFSYTKSFQKHATMCYGKPKSVKNPVGPDPQESVNHNTPDAATATSGTKIGSSILQYSCKQCGQSFTQRNHLANHLRIKKHYEVCKKELQPVPTIIL